jgi:hypothetical protein
MYPESFYHGFSCFVFSLKKYLIFLSLFQFQHYRVNAVSFHDKTGVS